MKLYPFIHPDNLENLAGWLNAHGDSMLNDLFAGSNPCMHGQLKACRDDTAGESGLEPEAS
jgi:hypothetical protein